MIVKARETFWSRGPAYVDGEIFLSAGETADVPLTPEALEAIRQGRLTEVRVSTETSSGVGASLTHPDESASESNEGAVSGNAPQGTAPVSTKPINDGDAIPASFPHQALLIGANLKTLGDVRGASDQRLIEIRGIGPQALRQIREALG